MQLENEKQSKKKKKRWWSLHGNFIVPMSKDYVQGIHNLKKKKRWWSLHVVLQEMWNPERDGDFEFAANPTRKSCAENGLKLLLDLFGINLPSPF